MTLEEKLMHLKELYESNETKKYFSGSVVDYYLKKDEIERLLNEITEALDLKLEEQNNQLENKLASRIEENQNLARELTITEFEKEFKMFKILKEKGIILADLAESLLEVSVITKTDEETEKYNNIITALQEYLGISKKRNSKY
jgi:hypothetical protein